MSYPTTIDAPTTNSTPTETVSLFGHSAQHNLVASGVIALQTKVGVDGSAVTTTHDYKLSGVTGSDKAVSKTGIETLTNKTITAPTLTGLLIKDTDFTVGDDGDTTKQVGFQLAGATASTKTTIAVSQTQARTITLPDATDTLVGKATTDTLTNKTFNAAGTGNSLSNVALSMFAANVADTDGTLAANSDTRVATQKAVKTYADAIAAGNGVITTVTTPVTIAVATDVTILTATVTANTLGTGYMVWGKLFFNAGDGHGNTLIITLSYGGTDYSTVSAIATNGTTPNGWIDFAVYATGATNSQLGRVFLSGTAFNINHSNSSTSAVDSTASKTLTIKARWNTVGAGETITFNDGFIRK